MTKAPQLNVVFSPEYERERVEYTLMKKSWFDTNGYTILLPKGCESTDIQNEESKRKCFELIEQEYDENFFNIVKDDLVSQWNWFIEHWPSEEITKTTLKFSDSYEIYLTRYGVKGSYNLPNEIIINVGFEQKRINGSVIFHEIIHLAIEEMVQKYHIKHWFKERTVDLLYKKLVPEKSFEQNLPKEVLAVDSIFNQYYGDLESILKNISKIQAQEGNQVAI